MEILVLTILILVNGFFALSEIALVSSKRMRLEQRKNEGSKGAKVALNYLIIPKTFCLQFKLGLH
jgi:putative hemolysin